MEKATPTIVICTRDRSRAIAFYRDILGLSFESADNFAAIFSTGGVTLRVSLVMDFVAHEHTILGFRVASVEDTMTALSEKGVQFNRYGHVKQDESGMWTAPGGAIKVAWMKDPDGNVLSVTNV